MARFIKKQNCEQCTAMFDKDPGGLVEKLVNDARSLLYNIMPKIFTLSNVKRRARVFLKREVNFEDFSCNDHKIAPWIHF